MLVGISAASSSLLLMFIRWRRSRAMRSCVWKEAQDWLQHKEEA